MITVLKFWAQVACQGLDTNCRPSSDCFWRSSLISVFPICYSDKHLWGLYRGFRDTGYLPFYSRVQGYMILSILLPGIWDIVSNILVTFRDSGFRKINYGDIRKFIKDTCLFTSRDMGYLVPPPPPPPTHTHTIHASLMNSINFIWEQKEKSINFSTFTVFVIFQSICEDVFLGGFSKFTKGLLRDPPLGIQYQLNKALHECAYPGVHNERYVRRPASEDSYNEIVRILEHYLEETWTQLLSALTVIYINPFPTIYVNYHLIWKRRDIFIFGIACWMVDLFYSLHASEDFCHLLITFANSFYPDLGIFLVNLQQFIWPRPSSRRLEES